MARWTCPACGREFGARGQGHVCRPGCTLDELFAAHPPAYRAAYDEVVGFLTGLGPVHEDVVEVGVFLKASATLAEVRPKARCLSLEIALPQPVEGPRVARRLQASGSRTIHIVKLHGPADVDGEVRGMLAEAMLYASAPRATRG